MNTTILLLETSTEVCSVAVAQESLILSHSEHAILNSHAEYLNNTIIQCLADSGLTLAQIDAIAVSSGPGSYTSLRIGVSTAKGICYALDKPLIAIDSLKILAHPLLTLASPKDYIIPMIDARRMEVYMSVIDSNNSVIKSSHAAILDEKTLEAYYFENNKFLLCGNGAQKYCDAFPSKNIELYHTKADARYMAELAMIYYSKSDFVDHMLFEPTYLKQPNITTPTKTTLFSRDHRQ